MSMINQVPSPQNGCSENHSNNPHQPVHVNNQIVLPNQPYPPIAPPQFSYTWRPSDIYNYGPSFRPNNNCGNYFGPSIYDYPVYPPGPSCVYPTPTCPVYYQQGINYPPTPPYQCLPPGFGCTGFRNFC